MELSNSVSTLMATRASRDATLVIGCPDIFVWERFSNLTRMSGSDYRKEGASASVGWSFGTSLEDSLTIFSQSIIRATIAL